jgi:hypothetical protein
MDSGLLHQSTSGGAMKDLRCLLTRHKFVTRQSPDRSSSYLECTRCGKIQDIPGGAFGALPPGFTSG